MILIKVREREREKENELGIKSLIYILVASNLSYSRILWKIYCKADLWAPPQGCLIQDIRGWANFRVTLIQLVWEPHLENHNVHYLIYLSKTPKIEVMSLSAFYRSKNKQNKLSGAPHRGKMTLQLVYGFESRSFWLQSSWSRPKQFCFVFFN